MGQKLQGIVVVVTICAVALLGATPAGSLGSEGAVVGDLNHHVHPVHGFCIAAPIKEPPPEHGSSAKCDLLIVPATQALVVETVSYSIQGPIPGFPDDLVFGRASLGDGRLFFGAPNGPDFNTFTYSPVLSGVIDNTNLYRGAYLTRFYLQENQILSAGVHFTAVAVAQQSFAFSGYLVENFLPLPP